MPELHRLTLTAPQSSLNCCILVWLALESYCRSSVRWRMGKVENCYFSHWSDLFRWTSDLQSWRRMCFIQLSLNVSQCWSGVYGGVWPKISRVPIAWPLTTSGRALSNFSQLCWRWRNSSSFRLEKGLRVNKLWKNLVQMYVPRLISWPKCRNNDGSERSRVASGGKYAQRSLTTREIRVHSSNLAASLVVSYENYIKQSNKTHC